MRNQGRGGRKLDTLSTFPTLRKPPSSVIGFYLPLRKNTGGKVVSSNLHRTANGFLKQELETMKEKKTTPLSRGLEERTRPERMSSRRRRSHSKRRNLDPAEGIKLFAHGGVGTHVLMYMQHFLRNMELLGV
ncbi:hypothetical protein V6N13_083014 [Hibiscus sabdariffa]